MTHRATCLQCPKLEQVWVCLQCRITSKPGARLAGEQGKGPGNQVLQGPRPVTGKTRSNQSRAGGHGGSYVQVPAAGESWVSRESCWTD